MAIQLFKDDVHCRIPQAFAAVDGTHIEIMAPDCPSKTDYFARTKRYTVNTQCIVGANLIFYSVATGSCHDARVWKESKVGKMVESGALQYPEEIVNNLKVKPFLLGDSAYRLGVNLMKPYSFAAAVSHEEKKFNQLLSGTRVTVERGIGALKCRWRILLEVGCSYRKCFNVVIACVVLHNFCQFMNDQYEDEDGLLNKLIRKEREASRLRQHGNTFTAAANHLRDTIKSHVIN